MISGTFWSHFGVWGSFWVPKVLRRGPEWIFLRFWHLFGVLGGLSLIGVGLTPANLYLELHIICATWLFRFFFVTSLCYTIVIYHDPDFENKYTGGYLIFTISILLYIIISEMGPNPKVDEFALTIQVISQKIILLIFMVAIYIQTLGLQKMQK